MIFNNGSCIELNMNEPWQHLATWMISNIKLNQKLDMAEFILRDHLCLKCKQNKT